MLRTVLGSYAPNQLRRMDFKAYLSTGDGRRCDPFTIYRRSRWFRFSIGEGSPVNLSGEVHMPDKPVPRPWTSRRAKY